MAYRTSQSSREYWQGHINQFKDSGMSGAAYCREQGISYSTFHNWIRKNRQKNVAKGHGPFTRVKRHSRETFKTQSNLKVHLPNSVILEFSTWPDPEWLKKLGGIV